LSSYTQANGCAASCHDDGATWNRRWIGVADASWADTNDASSAAVCGNCHGSFAEGWNIIGETDHVNPSATNDPTQLGSTTPRTQHDECTLCHGWGDAAYTGGKHLNGTITVNSDVEYVDTDGSCSVNCHDALALTMATNSGWTIDTVCPDECGVDDSHGSPGDAW
jgi:hypothetical protein